jgi:bifunctional NMN adenylyltransferase/nudix hydrolase
MTKKYDTLVFILRGQPFHNAHLEIVHRATALCDNLIIVVGSANQPRTYKNPFTFDDRRQMIWEATRGLSLNIHIDSNIDTIYNDQAWAARVQHIVSKYNIDGGKVGIIGHKKDESSFYFAMFPQWHLEEVPLFEPLDATNIRDLYFRRNANMNFIKSVVPPTTFQWLTLFKESSEYQQLINEREHIEAYKKQYASLPYPPIFVTSDAIVVQSGHVLMIKRRSEPGKGLMALPGGFVNANTDNSVQDAAIRELKEETGIKVPVPALIGNIRATKVFDAINRSARGRTITHAFHIQLPDGPLPKVKGSDDAEKAVWIPIGELNSSEIFEDHFEIISYFLGI